MRRGANDITPEIGRILTDLDIRGNEVRILEQLDRPVYVRVNDVLTALGGAWNRKAKAHLFPDDPSERIDSALLTGRFVNAVKDFDFYPTPYPVIRRMMELAEIRGGMSVLEPSAGDGRLARAAYERSGHAVTVCEIQPELEARLQAAGYEVLARDFLTADPAMLDGCIRFDRIVMNPPFSKRADIAHVEHAIRFLKPGGILVSVMPAGITFRTDRRTAALRDRLEIEELPEGSFTEAGTDVNTVLARYEAAE